eukprot:scaffold1490_cov162-Ochromonas_danica.AAC.52
MDCPSRGKAAGEGSSTAATTRRRCTGWLLDRGLPQRGEFIVSSSQIPMYLDDQPFGKEVKRVDDAAFHEGYRICRDSLHPFGD